MGMFDTIHHKIDCPKCNKPVIIEEQIKWADCLLRDLKVGDKLYDAEDGIYKYATMVRPELKVKCNFCEHIIHYTVTVKDHIITSIDIVEDTKEENSDG